MNKENSWGRLLDEYKDGKNKINGHIKNLKRASSFSNSENELQIADKISEEMGETIKKIKTYSFNEYRLFLKAKESDCLTQRQREILILRAGGMSFGEIGKKLCISRTAAFKTLELSIKKMEKN